MKNLDEAVAKVMAIAPNKRQVVPMRLEVAAAVAFPSGGIGAPGLRKERDKGRLVTEMIAGKEYVTLAEIDNMRELCRTKPKSPVDDVRARGEAAKAAALATADALCRQLRKKK